MARRCCAPPPNEFAPCYASVLAFPPGGEGELRAAVEALEQERPGPISCFTAWCPRCRGVYLLTTDMGTFPSPSAHHTHKLRLLQLLRAEQIIPPPPPSAGPPSI